MAQEQQTPPAARLTIVRGADNQLDALERLWTQGEGVDPRADEEAWQTLRRALNDTRRIEGARILFDNE